MTEIAVYSGHPVLSMGLECVITGTGTEEFAISAKVSEWEKLLLRTERLVLLDMTRPVTFEMLLELKSALPHSSVVLWSDPLPGECIRRALEAGVRGILYKHAEIEAYGECLRAVMRGHIWLESDRPADARKPGQAALTPRQRQLVDMLAQGLRNKEIAWRLGISEGTVKVYLSQLYGKLGVGDRLELALLAVRPICPPQANYTVPATAGAMPIA